MTDGAIILGGGRSTGNSPRVTPGQSPALRPKILFVTDIRHAQNPFVRVISEKLHSLGCRITCGSDEFWTCSPKAFDIIQVEWPEALADWRMDEMTEERLRLIEKRLMELRRNGCRICYTRHNILPHRFETGVATRLYALVERYADAVFHMARASQDEFVARYPASTVRNYIIPHHTYGFIDRSLSQEQARKRLNLPLTTRMVLAFGAFRSEEERTLWSNVSRKCSCPGTCFVAPRLNDVRVPDSELPDYFAAADVVFIQRVRILNSGNLPMGFYFGKVVVGPNVGNVGEILRNTGNPVFAPEDPDGAARAVEAGLELAAAGHGRQNRILADEEWDASFIARRMLRAYGEILCRDLMWLPPWAEDEDSGLRPTWQVYRWLPVVRTYLSIVRCVRQKGWPYVFRRVLFGRPARNRRS